MIVSTGPNSYGVVVLGPGTIANSSLIAGGNGVYLGQGGVLTNQAGKTFLNKNRWLVGD